MKFAVKNWRFSLRASVVLVAIFALAMMPVVQRQAEVRRQSRVIAQLEGVGAQVGFRHQWDDATAESLSSRAVENPLLLAVFGEAFFRQADFVSIVEFRGRSADLKALAELPDIDTVAIFNTAVDDTLIEILSRMPSLTYLNLSDSELNDEELLRLANIENVVYINAMGTDITAGGILDFKALRPNCELSVSFDLRFLKHYQRLVSSRDGEQ